MQLSSVFVVVAMWTSTLCAALPFPISNSTRILMRLSATFSVANPDTPSVETRFGNTPLLETRFGNTPSRASNNGDSLILFQNADNAVNIAPARIDKRITQGILQMTLEMDRAIASEGKALERYENTIFSPASISMALALVMLGARGQTLKEVSRVLGLASVDDMKDRSDLVHEQFGTLLARFDQDPSRNLPTRTTIANAIFIQQEYPIKERFERLSRDVYRSDIVQVDFARQSQRAGQIINRWVEAKTQGRIKGLLSSPPASETRVLLASALYFNGEWENPFPIEATKRRPFYVSGSKQNSTGSEVLEVTMMANGVELPYFSDADLGCQVVGLPYKGNKVAMYVILPNARGYEGLNALKDRLTVPVLDNLISNTRVTSVIISMPRMKLEATINLKSTLDTMGLRSLFDARYSDLGQISSGIQRVASRPYASRDTSDSDKFIFSSRFGEQDKTSDGAHENGTKEAATSTQDVKSRSIRRRRRRRQANDSNPGLYVDDVIHKVEIEVTETGTVASAATAVSISRDGSHRVVRLDRPFLFFIRHEESKLILFWGSVIRPT